MNFHFPKQLEHPLIIKEIISRKTVKLDFFYYKDGEVHKSYSVVTKTFRTEKSNFKMLVISTNTFIFSFVFYDCIFPLCLKHLGGAHLMEQTTLCSHTYLEWPETAFNFRKVSALTKYSFIRILLTAFWENVQFSMDVSHDMLLNSLSHESNSFQSQKKWKSCQFHANSISPWFCPIIVQFNSTWFSNEIPIPKSYFSLSRNDLTRLHPMGSKKVLKKLFVIKFLCFFWNRDAISKTKPKKKQIKKQIHKK